MVTNCSQAYPAVLYKVFVVWCLNNYKHGTGQTHVACSQYWLVVQLLSLVHPCVSSTSGNTALPLLPVLCYMSHFFPNHSHYFEVLVNYTPPILIELFLILVRDQLEPLMWICRHLLILIMLELSLFCNMPTGSCFMCP